MAKPIRPHRAAPQTPTLRKLTTPLLAVVLPSLIAAAMMSSGKGQLNDGWPIGDAGAAAAIEQAVAIAYGSAADEGVVLRLPRRQTGGWPHHEDLAKQLQT